MTDQPLRPRSPFGDDLWDALARYVSGESPAQEAGVVRRWLAEDSRRAEMVASLERSIGRLAFTPPADLDVEAALRRVKDRLGEPDVRSLPLRAPEHRDGQWRSMGLRAAAAVALLVGGGLIWRAMRVTTISPAVVVAAARTYTTPVGHTDSVRLSDGSVAVLAPGSTLEVAAGYGGELRAMSLRGEALFDVVHDEKRPFTVQAGSAAIEDLGTTFAVSNDADEGVRVVVTSGSVFLQGSDRPKQGTSKPRPEAPKDGVVLKAGDRGTVGRDGRVMAERAAATDQDLAWTRGRLVFDNVSLARVRSDLRRWYGIELRVVDSSLASRHLTASFAGEPIEQVLDVIALALGAKIERRGDTAVVHAR